MDRGTYRAPRSLFSQYQDFGPASARPLSDIREITEPNLLDAPSARYNVEQQLPSQQRRRPPSTNRDPLSRARQHSNQRSHIPPNQHDGISDPIRRSEDHASIYSIPLGNIPPRSSSKDPTKRNASVRRKQSTSVNPESAPIVPTPQSGYHFIPNTSYAQSPIRDASSRNASGRGRSIDPGRAARIPSKTIIKSQHSPSNEQLLREPSLPHPRLKVDLLLAAPLFVGGSSVEGVLRIVVDDAQRLRHRKVLTLERVTIDLLGVEEIMQPSQKLKRNIFLVRGNELVDTSHPPPVDMVESQEPVHSTKRSWILVPSISNLPFLLTLPLNPGPPPFECKFAKIRYVVCATLIIKDAGRQFSVRCSQETALLAVQDPEKALISLPSPLTATEQAMVSRSRHEHITVTTGLHRQVWVSGTNIFADVHVVNDSHKTVRKLELRLERIVLCYQHAAAGTLEISASGARMFDQKERITVVKSTIRPGSHGWNGVLPFTTVLRTCGLEVPHGHASISCAHKTRQGNFEVRYYLYISVHTTHSKIATVQLPIQIIHMNSLDVPTNSVAQVAAAIEERREGSQARGRPSLSTKASKRSLQGLAFAAPRMESLDRARIRREELESPKTNADPRKTSFQRGRQMLRNVGSTASFKTPPSRRKGRLFGPADADEISRQLHHMRKASVGSSATHCSVPRSRNPPRKSSALGYYLEEAEPPRATSTYAGSTRSSRRPSADSRRPTQSTRTRHPSHSRAKGKERALDW